MDGKKARIYILLFLIVALGFFLRIYNIDQAPPGVYPDEAVNGIDAVTANATGEYQWFYPANQGREGLFMNLIALCFKLLGVSVLTLKLPAIIFGTLTILGTFLLARELFNTRLALISAFLVSVSFWAINFNRISFRANMLPFILVFAFYFLFKGIRTKKLSDFAIGGFIFGLGLHTYIAFRIAPLILIIALAALILSRQNFLKEYWRHIAVFIALTTLAVAPMLYTFFYAHPEYFESRSSSISILSPEVNQGHLVQTFLRTFSLSLVKYNFWGDQNWRHNYPPYPILDTLSGIAFLFGFLYSFGKMLQFFFLRIARKIKSAELDKYAFLIAWFFAMLVPEFMTAEGLPHALRAIGTLPVVFIFAGLTFSWFLEKAEQRSFIYRKIVYALVVLMLISIGLFNSVKYHYFWANKVETARSFEKVLIEISDFIRTLPADREKIIITGSMQRIPITLFNLEMKNLSFLYSGQAIGLEPQDKDNFIVILTEKNNEIIKDLQNRFPELILKEVKDNLGISYYTLK